MSDLGQEWSNTNRSLGSRRSTETNGSEVSMWVGDVGLCRLALWREISGFCRFLALNLRQFQQVSVSS